MSKKNKLKIEDKFGLQIHIGNEDGALFQKLVKIIGSTSHLVPTKKQ